MNFKASSFSLNFRKLIKEVRKGSKQAIIATAIFICGTVTWVGCWQGAPYLTLVLGSVIFLVILIFLLRMSAKIDQRRKKW